MRKVGENRLPTTLWRIPPVSLAQAEILSTMDMPLIRFETGIEGGKQDVQSHSLIHNLAYTKLHKCHQLMEADQEATYGRPLLTKTLSQIRQIFIVDIDSHCHSSYLAQFEHSKHCSCQQSPAHSDCKIIDPLRWFTYIVSSTGSTSNFIE
jgi:hypothetical protein